MDVPQLKKLLLNGDPSFWLAIASATNSTQEFDQLIFLSMLRKKACARNFPFASASSTGTRIAILGGYSFYPFYELLEHFCMVQGAPVQIWLGSYDNYVAEIMEGSSGLYAFDPQVILLMPPEHRCKYPGELTDSRDLHLAEAKALVDSLLDLARRAHDATHAEILLTNFKLPAFHDLGPYRSKTLASDWSFRKWVNLELGLKAPPYLHICDLEFLTHRLGGITAHDSRAWFETKQLGSPELLVSLAREAAHLIGGLNRAPKKVLVLDLDNTLWGGVVADDGLEGIELGDTSPRGEAFKAFQKAILGLKQRGVLLAVCSKNDHSKAAEPFLNHPEMLLRMEDLVSFKANWEPKSESIRQMAAELNLGLDSFVFVDDNPAEIEIVRQFVPEVATILLGPDPAEYAAQLQDCRLFEPKSITTEDIGRTEQYRSNSERKVLESNATDMEAYLESLRMEAVFSEFTAVDIPRLAQLINKSNQFNLTTRRRSEADVVALMSDPNIVAFSVRLKDRFGDHGLISVVICEKAEGTMKIDTWLMSCRVLKRQVEELVLNEIVRLAQVHGCSRLEGLYIQTPKNEMVRDLYLRMGFALIREDNNSRDFEFGLDAFQPIPTKIRTTRRSYEPS